MTNALITATAVIVAAVLGFLGVRYTVRQAREAANKEEQAKANNSFAENYDGLFQNFKDQLAELRADREEDRTNFRRQHEQDAEVIKVQSDSISKLQERVRLLERRSELYKKAVQYIALMHAQWPVGASMPPPVPAELAGDLGDD